MPCKKILSVVTCLALFHSPLNLATPLPSFESGEHVFAGNEVKLFFSLSDVGVLDYKLHLPNGLQITYGELIAMGDFYGNVEQAISSGDSANAQQANFSAAFNTLARDSAAKDEAPKILAVIQAEETAIKKGMQQGEKPESIYARISNANNQQLNCITGGGCNTTWFLKPGRFLLLSENDYDHFGDNARVAYQAGHAVALQTAVSAYKNHDAQQLELAYAMNAFACHFLSDHFAAGHLRTPRVELPLSVKPAIFGALLASDMHHEENQWGLHVHNLRGDHWIAFGDDYYLDAQNQTNRKLLNDALQQSADDIFSAFITGRLPDEDRAMSLIPEPDEIQDQGNQDIAPLFYWQANKLYRRTDVNNPSARSWTTQWWGWTTLLLLAKNQRLSLMNK